MEAGSITRGGAVDGFQGTAGLGFNEVPGQTLRMPTRAIILKLIVPRNEGADAALMRRALWRTHQEINAATAYYERHLLLLRGRWYQTADAVMDAITVQSAAITLARGAQTANLAHAGITMVPTVSLGSDAEIITILGQLYAAIVPSVIGEQGTAQAANAYLSPLTDSASEGFMDASRKLDRPLPNWLALVDNDPDGALKAANAWFKAAASAEWRSDAGTPSTWLRKARLGDATWPKAFSGKLVALAEETREGLPGLFKQLRALNLLPLFPAYFAGRIANVRGAVTSWDRLAFRLAVAHLLSWESWNRRAAEEHARRTGILTKVRTDHVTGDVMTRIDALRDFERERNADLSTLGLGASEYRLMRRQLRSWPDLREHWLKSGSSDPDRLMEIATAEQTRLRRRFGDPAVFAWLAARAHQHIWRADPDAVSLLALLNAMEALVERTRETALMTLPDPIAHPRAVQWSAVGDSNLRPYRISSNDQGKCLTQLRLLVPRDDDSLLVDQEHTLKLAPSKQFEAPVFAMRNKKAVVTFTAAGTDTLSGVIGSADLLLDRPHLERRGADAIAGGDIGPAWLKLSLDLDAMPRDGWTNDTGKFANHFRNAANKVTGYEARVATGNRVLSVELGAGTLAACSVFSLTDVQPAADRFAIAIQVGNRPLWATHERSFHLKLQDEIADRAGLQWRREQDERLRRLRRALARYRRLLPLDQLAGAQRAETFANLVSATADGDPFPFEANILTGLERQLSAPEPEWAGSVAAARATFVTEMGATIKAWRRQGRARATDRRSGPSMWAIQHLSDIRRLLFGWSLMGRRSGDLRREDRAGRGVFASHLLAHIDALKQNRLKTGADMIVQAARGYQRDAAGRWRQAHQACDLILFEDLSRYRMLTDRPRRANSQLALWAHRAMPSEVEMQGELYGLAIADTGAAFSSRYHARSMTPGIRCRALTKYDLAGGYLRDRLVENGIAIEQLTAGDLVPWEMGETFVCQRQGSGLLRIDADINAAQNLQRRFWTRHGEGFRIPCHLAEIAGQRVYAPRGFGQRLLGAMGGYGVLEAITPGSTACRWRPLKKAELRKFGLSGAGEGAADATEGAAAEELQGLADEALQLSGREEVFFRDPSGVVLPADRWYPGKVFWGQVKSHAMKALAQTPSII